LERGSEGNDVAVSSDESESRLASSRRPAEGFGTAQVGTPSFGRSTRCKINQAAMNSRIESQSDIG
jgi:hypothetical protein